METASLPLSHTTVRVSTTIEENARKASTDRTICSLKRNSNQTFLSEETSKNVALLSPGSSPLGTRRSSDTISSNGKKKGGKPAL